MERNAVFGNVHDAYDVDLMKGIIINIRNGDNIKESKNILISMLEKLLSQMNVDDKKQALAKKYGMVMTEELEGRMSNVCNLSQIIVEQGLKQGREQGIEQERINAVIRMLKADADKAQIILFGYTEDEIVKAQKNMDLC